MILFAGLLACAPTAEAPLQMIPKVKCWTSSVIREVETDGVIDRDELEYSWNDDHTYVEFDGEQKSGYERYNELGFLTERFWEKGERSHESFREYDCDDNYCWITKMSVKTSSADGSWRNTETYSWEGGKRYFTGTGGWSGYTVFNEYEEPLEEFSINRWTREETRTKKTYVCDDWCRLQKKEKVESQIFGSEQSTTEYSWNGYHRTSNQNNNYRVFNEHGHVLEFYKEKPNRTIWKQISKDCEE